MKLSVIVGYYDEHDNIAMFLRTIDSIIPDDVDYEVIVVTDKENGKVLNHKNSKQIFTTARSFSEAYNIGLALSSGEYVILSNCDVLFIEENKSWFNKAIELLNDDVACVVPKVNVKKADTKEIYTNKYTLPCFFWLLKNPDTDSFFDELYAEGSHCEDADKCMEWYEQGKVVAIIPWFTILHTGGGVLRRKPNFSERLQRNKDLFNKKWNVPFKDSWLGKLNGHDAW